MNWEKVKLETIVENLDSKRKPLNDSEREKITRLGLYPYIGANNIMGYVDEYLFDEQILCLAEDGGSWGAGQICAKIYNGRTWVNNHAHVLKAGPNLNLKYLMYFLNHADLNKFISGSTRGKLTKGALNNIEVPLPPIDIQEQIANTLDKADALRRKDQELLTKYDDLAQAIFYDMFGDPVNNEKGWEIKNFGDFCNSFKYGTSVKCEEVSTNSNVPVIRIPNVLNNKVSFNDMKYGILSPKEWDDTKLSKGDLLFVRTNGNPVYIGRCAVYESDKESSYASYLIRARLAADSSAIPHFIQSVISSSSFRKVVLKSATTTAGNYNINTQALKQLKIIVPPLNLQKKYILIYLRIQKQLSICLKSSNKSEALFNDKLASYFS